MEERLVEDQENFKNSTDDSESESCSSSFCSGSDSERLPWLECVQSDGSLFYIQPETDLEPFLEDSLKHTYPVDSWSHIAQTKSKLNAAEKIKKWMKDRKKKVRKSFPLLKFSRSETNLNSPTADLFSNYESKEVYIDIDISKAVFPSEVNRLSTSERLLGLRLGSLEENISIYDKVSVLGTFASQDVSDVKVGDWLKSVNNIDVNMNNLEEILQRLSVPSRVKLNIMSPLSQMNAKSKFLPPRHNNFVKELSGDPSAIQSAKVQFQHVPHGLYYLTTEHGTFDNKDVVFKYPDENTPLFQLKGMLLTLGFMISDVASPPLLSCSVMVQKEIVHVGFIKEDENIMVLALPASVVSVTEVQHFASGLAKLFRYKFGSLSKTFITGNEENCLDNFLTLYFKHYLSSLYYAQSIFSEPHLLDILPSAHWLPLPNDLKTEIDDILSELESSDFGIDSDGFYGNRRIYNIFGSCLFYKGYLLSSHLPKDDLLDIYLYLHYNHILELTQIQSVSEIIIWKEVFPSRNLECTSDPEFQEEKGRWFLLVVVMQHCILAALLEDGGCALKVEGYPPPEPFYVEEVQNTLFILQDCGLTAATEKLLHFCMFPVTSPDLYFKENSLKNSLSSIHASNPSSHSSGYNMSSGRSTSHSSLVVEKEAGAKLSRCYSAEKMEDVKRYHLLSSMGPADGESDSVSSYSTGSNENMASFEKRFRSFSVSTGSTSKSHGSNECSQLDKDHQLSHRSCSSLPNLHAAGYAIDGTCFENSLRMAAGFGNHLFYYLHMDPVEGIFIAPVVPEVTSPGSVQNNILDSFHRCCLNMRTVFERSLRNAEINKANIKTKYGVNNFLQDAYEQGVMFKLKDVDSMKLKGSHHSSHFWVIGRLFFLPEPREVYVCYHDSIAQDVVEMAFRLGFGLSF